ncbi:protein trichome birefringence-like 19 [Momordica charantia]|uniref:Protein trichome birefringence-like 19 n=1 Tax=Momordica charantia TaxID=3673 RepID=A0A6J1BVP0_MOMCH|nr:protein trichome birefringence-like 19 [Momordica charantia]
MKLHGNEVPSGKNYTLYKTLGIVFSLVILTVIPLLYNLVNYSLFLLNSSAKEAPSSYSSDEIQPLNLQEELEECDIFTGEWVPNPNAPYYTSSSCWAIHEHQNCMKYGRPDGGFMQWRWKPDDCELPIFNPSQFLELMRDKSLAFVGDSVGRNQMQSLICLLSRVEYPIDVSTTADENFKRWKYTSYNFTMAIFWTPHLVKAAMGDSNGPTQTGLFNLYLDEHDQEWTTYGHLASANVTLYNDCVHWCLPGPIDAWSDFLLEMLKMEGIRSARERLQFG